MLFWKWRCRPGIWQAIGHAARDVNMRLPYLPGCNDLMQNKNRLRSFGFGSAQVLMLWVHR